MAEGLPENRQCTACSCGALANADKWPIQLHWQAFEAARLLRAEPCLDTQLRDAQELLPAMQRWSESSRLRSHVGHVVVLSCSEATTPQAAIELAERVFSFLLTGEFAPPAAGDR